MPFSGIELLSLLSQLSLLEIALGGIENSDAVCDGGGFIVAASQKSWRVQVIVEKITQRVGIFGVQRHRPLESLPRLRGKSGGLENIRHFRPLAIRATQPVHVFAVF